jgi:hypothetical protein
MSGQDALEELASAWLAAEERSTIEPGHGQVAVQRGIAYEAALAGASIEDIRLAYEAARQVQTGTEMGSREWVAARRVSELLRVEYLAAKGSRE